MTLPLLDTLLANPGLYIGIGTEPDDGSMTVARIVVTPLPNRASVAIDYEARHPANPTQWSEHAILGSTHDGKLMLISSNEADNTLTFLYEDTPGFFVNRPDEARFPIGIRMEVEEPGVLRYDWWYSMPGQPLVQHDDTVVRRVS